MSLQLGPETIDSIIDHLHDDKHSLRSCSLTCKEWLPSSRYHLFSELLLSPFNVTKFRRLLDTTHGDIASIPWHLTVADFSGYVCWHEGIDIAVVNEDLRIVSSRLQKVTVLNMLHSEELGSDILSNLTSVRQLEMIKMSVSGMDDIFKFVHDIPELEALSMEDISWNSCEPITRDHTQLSRRPSFAMGTVRLEGAAFTDVTNWLLHLRPMPAIHTFHCDAYDPATSRNRDVLLQTVGPTIRSLHLYFNNRPNGLEETMHLINISSCTNIHSLYLVDIPTHMVYSRWLLDILSQITSHSLRALILDFSTPEDGSSWINSIDQKGVARILGDTKFDKLRTLGVDCRLRVGSVHNLEYLIERRRNSEVERFVSEGPLSDWNRRGILWFIYTDEWKSYKLR